MGIEPTSPEWETGALPLSYTRVRFSILAPTGVIDNTSYRSSGGSCDAGRTGILQERLPPYKCVMDVKPLIALILATALAAGQAAAAAAELAPSGVRTSGVASATEDATGEAVLWYFGRDGCPACAQAEKWLDELEDDIPGLRIHRIEVVDDPAGLALFIDMMRSRSHSASAVPTFILGDHVWVGFSPHLAATITRAVHAHLADAPGPAADAPGRLDLGPFGSIELAGRSLFAATVLVAFVDGFNPCSLWVLTVLLAMIIGSRSRARIAAVGLTFLTVTASIYGVFIAGLFTALVVAGQLGWIQTAVALLALGFGLINIKDFFAYKQGLSLTIPDRFKPRIYRGGRAVREDRPLPVTLAITVLLAGGVALIELPCTAGFPVIWTSLLAEAGVGAAGFGMLLGLYLLTYLSVEIAILAGALITLRASRLQERHGRTLKLVGGMVMVALALVLVTDPSIMESLTGSLAVVGGALAASAVVLWAQRRRMAAKD